jgi:hypothetical protein
MVGVEGSARRPLELFWLLRNVLVDQGVRQTREHVRGKMGAPGPR